MSPIVTEAFGLLAKAIAEEVVKNLFTSKAVPADLFSKPAANDDVGKTSDSKATDTPSKDKVSGETGGASKGKADSSTEDNSTPEDLRAEALALINVYAPTHGPAIRKALADVGAKRLSEVKDAELSQVLEALKGLADA
ncbi:hypothetical protein SB5439_05122 [Klebsiella variicola]|uniref:hypothetical protein n=1 Tax=Klebsiella variicola TaxID=244366 RepID=UPI00109C63F1|nr:hypothetical protein [Klebsiella variicola]VGQ12978.1 hypothetical protein SB5439_05122 [Klebsiella variicola]